MQRAVAEVLRLITGETTGHAKDAALLVAESPHSMMVKGCDWPSIESSRRSAKRPRRGWAKSRTNCATWGWENMSSSQKPAAKRPRGRPPKALPRIEASPERVARAMFSAVQRPDPSIRLEKTGSRTRKRGA